MNVVMKPDDVALLEHLLSKIAGNRVRSVTYDGANLSIPDDLAVAVSRIIGDSSWKKRALAAILRDYAASVRQAKEAGGVTLGGMTFPIDAQTQARVVGATVSSPGANQFIKLIDGTFASLSAGQVSQLAAGIAARVDALNSVEAGVASGIVAGSITTRADVDGAFSAV